MTGAYAGGLTLVRLEASGLITTAKDDTGAAITVDDRDQVALDGDLIYFNGSVNGDQAIWRRELNGEFTKNFGRN